jgi:acetolactate synthase-1/2/3 large subunit
MKAWTATTPDQFDHALEQAFEWKKGPCFIDVHVESIADRVPPVSSWLTKKGRDPLALEADDISFL